jgi:23S rRNA (cytidine1920-2'-O)/16S rRNA (cytidine1409-2'-O)-methyltransferase
MSPAPSRPSKLRLDQALVQAGLAPNRSRAQALILAGRVTVNGDAAAKPGQAVAEEARLAVAQPEHDFASRGGVKLEGALGAFAFDPTGRVVLDVGASTGGFTDVLLRRGARSVIALDVGYGQLDWALRSDPRVVVIERTNIRHVVPGQLEPPPEAAVVDVSFISLAQVLPPLIALLPPSAEIVALVKPQFEVGRAEVGKGGVVRDPAARERAVERIAEVARGLGCTVLGREVSPLPGPKGNVEHFLWLRTPTPP